MSAWWGRSNKVAEMKEQAEISLRGMPVNIQTGEAAIRTTIQRAKARIMRLQRQREKHIAAGRFNDEWLARIDLQIQFYTDQVADLDKRMIQMKAFR